MIDYPNKLNIIFDKLKLFHIKPVIVGGYIRDKLLKLDSKDIDIELYGLDSLHLLEEILSEFGSINSVGKSFGVCKLQYQDLDIDFSLPRSDSKIDSGHRGFKITTDKNLDFKTAASRRDFTINAIGYDVEKKVLLDPFSGISDLNAKILRAVDLEKFDEDPLRVLRCVQFSARFQLNLDEKLFSKCKAMIASKILDELPSERIYEEFKKMLLKSEKPSKGFALLKELDAFSFFTELSLLSTGLFNNSLLSVDFLEDEKIEDEKKRLTLMLALICKEFSQEQIDSFLNKLTQEVKLHHNVKKLVELFQNREVNVCTDYYIYSLAKEFEVESFLLFLDAAQIGKNKKQIEICINKAKSLNVYKSAMPAFLQGKDLISLGLNPGKEFSTILEKSYTAQMQGLFRTKSEALSWVKENLLS